MAVAIELRFPGTLAEYDEVMQQMDLPEEGPEGALFHWVAATDDGIMVVDVWETMEQFDRFARENIGPQTQKAGMPQPHITTHAVHNHLPSA